MRIFVAAFLLSGCATFGVARCPEPAPRRDAPEAPLVAQLARAKVREAAIERQATLAVEPPRQLGYSSDGTSLLTAGDDKLVQKWDTRGMRELASIAPPEGGILRFFLAVHADRGLVALRDGTAAAVYDMSGTRIYRLDGHETSNEFSEPVDSAAFSPDGRWLATGDEVGTLRIWSIADGKLVGGLSLGSDRLTALTFSPDSRMVAAAIAADEGVRLVDVDKGGVIGNLPTDVEELYHVDFSRDGSRLVAADFTEAVSVWELDSCRRIDLVRPEGFATDVKISRDGTVVAAAMSEALVMWDARTGKELVHARVGRESSQSTFRSLAFSPDDATLALGSSSGVTLVPLRR